MSARVAATLLLLTAVVAFAPVASAAPTGAGDCGGGRSLCDEVAGSAAPATVRCATIVCEAINEVCWAAFRVHCVR
jgi:hypothetical protein